MHKKDDKTISEESVQHDINPNEDEKCATDGETLNHDDHQHSSVDDVSDNEADLTAEVESLDDSIETMKTQIKEYEDRLLRVHAEMENIRRRAERDVSNAHKYSLERMIKDLLPVIDSLEKAQDHSFDNEEAKAIHEGVMLTIKMFFDVLHKFGVECVDPINERFNPEFHEAMSVQEQEGVEANTVTQVLEKGYILNGRLVRPARVLVSK